MKTISLLFLIGLMSISAGSLEKMNEKTVTGIWQGALGDIRDVTEVVVDITGKDSLVVNVVGKDQHFPGVINALSDSTIQFAYYDPKAADSCRFAGNLNRTKNFIEGEWKLKDRKGSFFFQKVDSYQL